MGVSGTAVAPSSLQCLFCDSEYTGLENWSFDLFLSDVSVYLFICPSDCSFILMFVFDVSVYLSICLSDCSFDPFLFLMCLFICSAFAYLISILLWCVLTQTRA